MDLHLLSVFDNVTGGEYVDQRPALSEDDAAAFGVPYGVNDADGRGRGEDLEICGNLVESSAAHVVYQERR
jgi:hypothetical protein